MLSNWVLFDRQGKVLSNLPTDLAVDLRGIVDLTARLDYVLKNLGYAAARQHDSSNIVRFRPSHVGELAFFAMLLYSQETKPSRILVETFEDGAWASRICANSQGEGASALLRVFRRAQPAVQPNIVVRPRSPSSLAPRSPLRKALEYWVDSAGRYNAESLASFTTRQLADRYALVSTESNSPRMIIARYGQGLPACARAWLRKNLESDFSNQPDRNYGLHCSNVYRQVALTGTPCIANVDAFVDWPGFGKIRRRYQRLVLPFDSGRNQVHVLGATLPDDSIDLRPCAV